MSSLGFKANAAGTRTQGLPTNMVPVTENDAFEGIGDDDL